MKVTLFSCGPAANESELKGFEYLKSRLQSEPLNEEWVLLTNMAFSVTHQLQSDEIDLIAIGPTGVRVIEIKHWTAQWFDAHKIEVADAADLLTNKARKVGSTLRRAVPDLPRVDGAVLLTQEPSKVKRIGGLEVRGVNIHTLSDWKVALDFDAPRVLSPQQVTRLANLLQPQSVVAIDGSLRRLAGYVNLELQSLKEQRFHRTYKGSHPSWRDQVVLHLYDLSADDSKNAEAKARREFETLHYLQRYQWAPRILDSYREAPGYHGEMFFFTVVDPMAPSIEERAMDATWTEKNRLVFARNAIRALSDLHAAGSADDPIIHRNLTPKTILVKHDDSAILTGFERSRIPSDISVASSSLPTGQYPATFAPEVRTQGLAASDQRSDIYSICACLSYLFQGRDDEISQRAIEQFKQGLADEPSKRCTLQLLDTALSEMLGESAPPPAVPPARFWTEEQVIRFRDNDYRIVSKLGSGGVGTTFKVVKIDRYTKQDVGTYVAKLAHDGETGQRVLKAYSLVHSHLRHTALSTIFEVAREWEENQLIALMTWISGAPLGDFAGIFPLLAEEQQETSSEELALRWLRIVCEALNVLHRNGLIHGDVSPRNLIVSGSELVLTDYDFVGKIGEPLAAPGTVLYCSPSYNEKALASPSDDIYALAATFFQVVFDKEPFRYGGERDKKRGLNWEGVTREEYPVLAAFLDKATHPESKLRFAHVSEALAALQIQEKVKSLTFEADEPKQSGLISSVNLVYQQPRQPELREERVEWLRSLLQSYPGSPFGNQETRGLDTKFAAQTYVQTPLEETLIRDIHERNVRLVILCGNAGDGKTALLQHLAARLKLGEHKSSKRILEGHVPDGSMLRMNLDGSASWQGESADDLLDKFLAPFQDGPPTQDIVHLLAINDGRLLEWIEGVGRRNGVEETRLTTALDQLLQENSAPEASYIRFVNLNQRSLVGGVTQDRVQVETSFLERLLDQLYGGEQAVEIWSPCLSCSAKGRCEVFRAARLFAPETLPALAEPTIRIRARQRLFEALQAVHLRGETHISMRELRSALVYILFGLHFCDDYHAGTENNVIPYWNRAFEADSPLRQGEVLGELARFDPALEAHPQIDRHLLSTPSADSTRTAPSYPHLDLESARRRAFFEWTQDDTEQIAGERFALDLARGRHLRLFRDLPMAQEHTLKDVCEQLCKGISRLEDLPPQALDRSGVVPLRITPRTPTETAFWVEKPLDAFRLEADISLDSEGIERLHRQAHLIYRYRSGHGEENLRLGAELFHLLLELAEGYQLGDVSTDDTFAHLSIFVQRLIREDERELLAWNPMQDEAIYQISSKIRESENGKQQPMKITLLAAGDAA